MPSRAHYKLIELLPHVVTPQCVVVAQAEPAVEQDRMRPGVADAVIRQSKLADDFKAAGTGFQQGDRASLVEHVEPLVSVDCGACGQVL